MLHGSCALSSFTLPSTISRLHAIILYSCHRLICLLKLFTQSLQRIKFIFTILIVKASPSPLKEFRQSLVFIPWLVTHVPLVLKLTPLEAPLPTGLGSDLVFSTTKSFSSLYIRNRISIMTGLSVRCKASWWTSIAFAILPPRMPLLLMKPVGGLGRV